MQVKAHVASQRWAMRVQGAQTSLQGLEESRWGPEQSFCIRDTLRGQSEGVRPKPENEVLRG